MEESIRSKVIEWAFDLRSDFNLRKVLVSERPMVVPLRISLLNSLCVPTIYLKEHDFTEQINDRNEDQVDHTDGCGIIHDIELLKSIVNAYNHNMFTSTTERDTFRQRTENSFTQLGGNYKNNNAKDLTFDLPTNVSSDYTPSAIQIRFRGFKGMLVFFPKELCEEKYTNHNKGILFTSSMKKLECPIQTDTRDILNNISIVGMSQSFKCTTLSSELIYLFSGLCEKQQVMEYFRKILFENRSDLEGKKFSDLMKQKEIMCELMRSRYDHEGIRLVNKANAFLGNRSEIMSKRMKNLDQNGVGMVDKSNNLNSFLGTETFQNYLLSLNVPIPESAYIYGVADFTGTLREGEVFLQVTTNIGSKVIEDDILVTKTPTLFHTDLRLFKAVKNEKLMHLRDVLVFPTKGETFAPSLMANADLDGDHFNVFWSKELINMTKKDMIKYDDNQDCIMFQSQYFLFGFLLKYKIFIHLHHHYIH